jgi:reverse gyrase
MALLCSVQSIKQSEGKRQRPLPLNTVELLKICSNNFGISPATAMNIAERLYALPSIYINYSSQLTHCMPLFSCHSLHASLLMPLTACLSSHVTHCVPLFSCHSLHASLLMSFLTSLCTTGDHLFCNVECALLTCGRYIRGYISYPRTESTHYPDGFDFIGTLKLQSRASGW